MQPRKASIKESGEELSSAEWARFDAAVAEVKAERDREPIATPASGAVSPAPGEPQAVA